MDPQNAHGPFMIATFRWKYLMAICYTKKSTYFKKTLFYHGKWRFFMMLTTYWICICFGTCRRMQISEHCSYQSKVKHLLFTLLSTERSFLRLQKEELWTFYCPQMWFSIWDMFYILYIRASWNSVLNCLCDRHPREVVKMSDLTNLSIWNFKMIKYLDVIFFN